MNRIRVSTVFAAVLCLFFWNCSSDEENIAPVDQTTTSSTDKAGNANAKTTVYYYVNISGNDTYGNGTASNPWRTLRYAVTKVPANVNNTIKLSQGTFVESGLIEVPTGINIEGSGKDLTIIKAASSFYYYPATPGYASDKFLLRLKAESVTNGNQTLSNFTIDGDSKKLHGGIYVRYRNNVTIDNVRVRYTNFTGIWIWDAQDTNLRTSELLNCSWGSSSYCSGALNVGNITRMYVDNISIDENVGYGIKAIGPSGTNTLNTLKVRGSKISVAPIGLWNSGKAPNIAIEYCNVVLQACEISNCRVDNTISLISTAGAVATGNQTIRIYNNVLDMEKRAQGAGYGVELTIHDVEIDNNYFIKGRYGIANWAAQKANWKIHHNVFYGIQCDGYPGEVLRSQNSGMKNVKFYNNTIEFIGTRTSNVIGLYGGSIQGLYIKNNLIMNNNTSYNYYPNQFIHVENSPAISDLQVWNNLLHKLPIGSVVGNYLSNLTSDPKIKQSGVRPNPYYVPAAGSPIIDAGVGLGFSFLNAAPDIGAYEY